MKSRCYVLLLMVNVLILTACTHKQQIYVDDTDSRLYYQGRIDTAAPQGIDFYWSGTSVTLNFEGETIEVEMQDETGDNYYNAILDNDSILVFRPDTVKRNHLLFKDLKPGKHRIEVFKRTEWNRGKTTFFGFQIYGKAMCLPRDAQKKRKIEFYGNSITAGYAVEDFSGKDQPDSSFTNNYLSYAALTARHFNAHYSCICKSGIGILISWFPMTMPELYNRLIPEDSTSKWDFSEFTPDVVVINLFQNDSWLVNMPEYETFKLKFGTNAPEKGSIIEAYRSFVQAIRSEYPNAQIICALGNMDATREGSLWPTYISEAVAESRDSKIYTFFMPYKNTPGHPTIAEQQLMADSLIHFMETKLGW